MEAFPFTEAEWAPIRELALPILDAHAAGDDALSASLRLEMLDRLADLRERRGDHPALLETIADYTNGDAERAEIFRSRLETTRALREAIAASDAPPPLWFNASTATIYRHAEDRPMTESTGELGTGFSVNVAKAWEREFFAGELPGTRRVALRMAIVLGDGSALVPLMMLTRFGLGGPQRDGRWFATTARRNAGTFHEFRARGGRQKFSWVHIRDVLGAIEFLRGREDIAGPVNIAAPNPSDNRTMMATLRRVLGVPVGLPAYRWMLEIGSAVIRTETELVLKSRWVLPERLLEAGYDFAFPELEPALRDIAGARELLRGTASR